MRLSNIRRFTPIDSLLGDVLGTPYLITVSKLRTSTDTRMILGQSLEEIISELLGKYGFAKQQIQFAFNKPPSPKVYVLQAMESDFDFLARPLAVAGVFSGHLCLMVKMESLLRNVCTSGLYVPSSSCRLMLNILYNEHCNCYIS